MALAGSSENVQPVTRRSEMRRCRRVLSWPSESLGIRRFFGRRQTAARQKCNEGADAVNPILRADGIPETGIYTD